jgi:hypothetical protein
VKKKKTHFLEWDVNFGTAIRADRVNSLYATKSEPIRRVGGSPKATPINPDRFWLR